MIVTVLCDLLLLLLLLLLYEKLIRSMNRLLSLSVFMRKMLPLMTTLSGFECRRSLQFWTTTTTTTTAKATKTENEKRKSK